MLRNRKLNDQCMIHLPGHNYLHESSNEKTCTKSFYQSWKYRKSILGHLLQLLFSRQIQTPFGFTCTQFGILNWRFSDCFVFGIFYKKKSKKINMYPISGSRSGSIPKILAQKANHFSATLPISGLRLASNFGTSPLEVRLESKSQRSEVVKGFLYPRHTNGSAQKYIN